MIRTRRLELVGPSETKGQFMKVAFASTDKVNVDEHFGHAEEFVIWEIGPDAAEFIGMVQVDQSQKYIDDKIAARSAALKDVAIVCVYEIGGPAAARLVQDKIHPIKAKNGESIQEMVDKLQDVLQGSPPPWMRKAMMKNERPSL